MKILFLKKEILILLAIFSLGSCSKYKVETQDFKTYYNIISGNEPNEGLYILFPLSACHGCLVELSKQLDSVKEKETSIEIIFISVSTAEINTYKHKLPNYKSYSDKKELVYNYNLTDGAHPWLIEYNGNEITNITEAKVTENMPDVFDIILKHVK